MIDLVNSLLDISHLESGKIVSTPSMTDLTKLTSSIISQLSQQVEQKLITINTTTDPNLPNVYVDPKKISMVITNLLTNAIKYSPQSSTIDITLKCISGHLQFCILDHGWVFQRVSKTMSLILYKPQTHAQMNRGLVLDCTSPNSS
jgi:signal transduction histidine kinase